MKKVKLTEATLNRIVDGHDEKGYAIISACRQDCLDGEVESPTPEDIWDENNIRTDYLKQAIKKMGYSYVPVFGGYKEKNADNASVEKAFIVFPYDIMSDNYEDFEVFEEDMKHLGQEFGQDSVLIKEPDGQPRYWLCNENKWEDYSFSGVSLNDVQREFFTSLKGWKDTSRRNKDKEWTGSPQRFSYVESYVYERPMSIMEAHRRRGTHELFSMQCYEEYNY